MTSIKKDLLSGVFYTAIAKYMGILVSLVIAGILARLIAPEEFGIVAVVTVIITFSGYSVISGSARQSYKIKNSYKMI